MLPDCKAPVHTETLVIRLISMWRRCVPPQRHACGSVTQLCRHLSRKIDLLDFYTFTDLKTRKA